MSDTERPDTEQLAAAVDGAELEELGAAEQAAALRQCADFMERAADQPPGWLEAAE